MYKATKSFLQVYLKSISPLLLLLHLQKVSPLLFTHDIQYKTAVVYNVDYKCMNTICKKNLTMSCTEYLTILL